MTDADLLAIQLLDPRHAERQLGHVVAEEPVDAVPDDLGQAADAAGDDRRATGQRLDRDQPERLRPRARHHDCVGRRDEGVSLVPRDLTDELGGGPAFFSAGWKTSSL